MARMKVGDRIIVTQGDFKGDRGSITHKTWFTKGLKVALEKNGDEIKTKEGHVQLAD